MRVSKKTGASMFGFAALLHLLALVSPAFAGSLVVQVTDGHGAPVADAAVYATALNSQPVPHSGMANVAQHHEEFTPLVTVVQAGMSVRFPNEDQVKHHVYSFSAAKKFELPLYSGTLAAPVVFDKPGLITLGCNIHDWMIGYILVVDTPCYAVTGADGKAELKEVPAGACKVEVWHPRLLGTAERQIEVASGANSENAAFQVALKPVFRIRRSPSQKGGGYH